MDKNGTSEICLNIATIGDIVSEIPFNNKLDCIAETTLVELNRFITDCNVFANPSIIKYKLSPTFFIISSLKGNVSTITSLPFLTSYTPNLILATSVKILGTILIELIISFIDDIPSTNPLLVNIFLLSSNDLANVSIINDNDSPNFCIDSGCISNDAIPFKAVAANNATPEIGSNNKAFADVLAKFQTPNSLILSTNCFND